MFARLNGIGMMPGTCLQRASLTSYIFKCSSSGSILCSTIDMWTFSVVFRSDSQSCFCSESALLSASFGTIQSEFGTAQKKQTKG